MDVLDLTWRKIATYSAITLYVVCTVWLLFRSLPRLIQHIRYKKLRLRVNAILPNHIEEVKAKMANYDPQIDGHIMGIEEAACVAYKNHPASDIRSINHVSVLIYAACQNGKLRSYDAYSLIPFTSYSGLSDNLRHSAVFLGEVNPDHLYEIAVNIIEVLEWLEGEGFLTSQNLLDDLKAPVKVTMQTEPVELRAVINEASQSQTLEKPLSKRERDTLLIIIAVLCKEAKLDYAKHAKTAGLIQSTAATMGISIGESTIESHLKKIVNALGSRTK